MMRAIVAFLLMCCMTAPVWAHAGYTGYSGAPGRGSCASTCHGSDGGTITVTDFPTSYVPLQTYTITIGHSSGTPIMNFNASCRVGTGSDNAGTITAEPGSETYDTPGETNGVHLSETDVDQGVFDWTAPAAGTGDVRLYLAGHQGPFMGPNTNLVLLATEAENPNRAGDRSAPLDFRLGPVYPNPFNPSAEIRFELPRAQQIRLAVFDILGKEVAVLQNGMMQTGHYTVTFDGSALPSGIYFARLDAGKESRTQKMMLLK